MTNPLVEQIAKRFIQRRDVKAVQFASGAYVPDRELKHLGNYGPLGFRVPHLEDHLSGKVSYGHYLLDADSKCRVFVLDIDLEKNVTDKEGNIITWGGSYCRLPSDAMWTPDMSNDEYDKLVTPVICDPRAVWSDRSQIEARNWYKYQFGMLARKFVSVIQSELGIPCAAAYSGNKGIHVYGFTGEMPAAEVRAAALLVLKITDEWEPSRGVNFFKHKIESPFMGYPSFSIEVFPKQDSLDGKDLGNLVRLPLGKNLKSPDPTFFLDLRTPVAQMVPHADPVHLLSTGNPYGD